MSTLEFPPTDIDAAFKQFFRDFYAISDDPDAHEQYAQQFAQNATLIMASKQVQGYDAILALRKSMWEKVASRRHRPLRLYPFDEREFMLCGSVDYVYKDGKRLTQDWGARAALGKDNNGVVALDYYQVYLDTAAVQFATNKGY